MAYFTYLNPNLHHFLDKDFYVVNPYSKFVISVLNKECPEIIAKISSSVGKCPVVIIKAKDTVALIGGQLQVYSSTVNAKNHLVSILNMYNNGDWNNLDRKNYDIYISVDKFYRQEIAIFVTMVKFHKLYVNNKALHLSTKQLIIPFATKIYLNDDFYSNINNYCGMYHIGTVMYKSSRVDFAIKLNDNINILETVKILKAHYGKDSTIKIKSITLNAVINESFSNY